jgi:N-alpha-acetyltransferase 30
VQRAIQGMALQGATEVVLEAETHNAGALAMYEGLGFIRDKRLERSVILRVEGSNPIKF